MSRARPATLPDAVEPDPPARNGRRRTPEAVYPVVGVVAVLVLFELLSRLDIAPQRFFPPVSEMFVELASELGTGAFWTAAGNTIQGWAVGLALAVAIAVPLGLLIGSSLVAFRSLRALIEFLRPIPSVALIPLAILLYGRSLETKVFLIVFASLWPLLIQAIYGVRDVDPVSLDTARAYGLGRWATVWRVTLPSALPYIATGLRIASATALVLAITAELVVGAAGLGREILVSQSGGAITRMYAYILAAGLLGWGLNSGIVRIESRLLRWHPAYREGKS